MRVVKMRAHSGSVSLRMVVLSEVPQARKVNLSPEYVFLEYLIKINLSH